MFQTTISLYTKMGKQLVSEGIRLAPWAFPATVGISWMVWPALTDNFKRRMGLLAPLPEDEA